MGTVVSIWVSRTGEEAQARVERAFAWFAHVERVCSRFEAESEVVRLTRRVGVAVQVSPVLFQAVRFAMALTAESGGAFDVTVGCAAERRGFNENYRTGVRHSFGDACREGEPGRLSLDEGAQTITLMAPMLLDLGAVAKGLAMDLAARELAPLGDYAIDAGGDIYVSGLSQVGPWRVGIQDPRHEEGIAAVLQVAQGAVCTSGDYLRHGAYPGEHHIIDPATGASPTEVASVTVVARNGMLADGLSTAAFVLGIQEGLALIERSGAEGMIITRTLERMVTPGFDSMVVTEGVERLP